MQRSIFRPGDPTMSPMKSMRQKSASPVQVRARSNEERSASPCVLGPEPHDKVGHPAPALRLSLLGEPIRDMHKGRTTRAPWDPVLVQKAFATSPASQANSLFIVAGICEGLFRGTPGSRRFTIEHAKLARRRRRAPPSRKAPD